MSEESGKERGGLWAPPQLLFRSPWFHYEDMEGGTVINAERSLMLQDAAPEVKPVVKGTRAEVQALQSQGRIRQERIVFIASIGVAYIVDLGAVQAIYGGTQTEALRQAKLDLLAGGDQESALLGYPPREGLEPWEKIPAAVTLEGLVVTDPYELAVQLTEGNVIWAAEGGAEEVTLLAGRVARALKNSLRREVDAADGGDDQDRLQPGQAVLPCRVSVMATRQ